MSHVRLWSPEEDIEGLPESWWVEGEDEGPPWFRVTDLKQYAYCPRILYFTYTQPLPHAKPSKVEEGKLAHEALKRRLLRRWPPRGLPKGREVWLDVPVAHSEWRVRGKVDAVVLLGESEAAVVDFKHSHQLPEGWRLQVVLYGLLVEASLGYRVREGYIYLMRTRRGQRVPLTARWRAKVERLVQDVRRILEGSHWPEGATQLGRCVGCEFRRFCNDRF